MEIIPDRFPWECPRCHHVNAPHVDQCPCGGPGGGVTADVPAPPPAQPPATVTMTHPWQWWAANTTASGAGTLTLSFPSVRDIAREVVREELRWQLSNSGRGSARQQVWGTRGTTPA